MTEPVVRVGGGIIWRHGQGGGVELVLVHRPAGRDRGPGGLREVEE
jgi:8-oxo-dGTP pyrophosphatase MutT (NUDIX family)